MCGRYSFTSPPEAVRRLFGLAGPMPDLAPRYNIAPTQSAPVVRLDAEGARRELALMRWGLVPAWSKGPDSRFALFNARAETVAEKPAFRDAFRDRRCLVPADGFYEWRHAAGGKQPYRLTMDDGSPFAFAGLWARWRSPAGEVVDSYAILTTGANALIAPIHDRMPVIVDPADYPPWLAGPAPSALLRPYRGEAMRACPVSRHVNDATHDDARCFAPAAPTPPVD